MNGDSPTGIHEMDNDALFLRVNFASQGYRYLSYQFTIPTHQGGLE
jgi:hypothetical protein